MRKRIYFLKSKKLIDKANNVEENFLAYIEYPKLVDELRKQIHIKRAESLAWIDIHSKILNALLSKYNRYLTHSLLDHYVLLILFFLYRFDK